MAHYARVNNENIITFVTPIPNEMITDINGVEHEDWAFKHLYETIPDSLGDRWVQTSYNNNFRVRYVGLGYSWNQELNAFIPPKPYESWSLNEETCLWEAPVAYPTDGEVYDWDEDLGDWVKI